MEKSAKGEHHDLVSVKFVCPYYSLWVGDSAVGVAENAVSETPAKNTGRASANPERLRTD
jgi:hypothetical protein